MMEAVVNKIVAELTTITTTAESGGGVADILTIEAVYFGDPGVIPVNSYPCFLVQPIRDTPDIETTAYEVRNLEILITVLIDARAYFEAIPLEASGDRQLVRVVEKVRNWFRRDSKRSLDGLEGVREVEATAAEYNIQVRGGVIAKAAQVTLVVNQQRYRQS